jgi:hypothetical protein
VRSPKAYKGLPTLRDLNSPMRRKNIELENAAAFTVKIHPANLLQQIQRWFLQLDGTVFPYIRPKRAEFPHFR